MKTTEYIELTEMWQDGSYSQVGDIIRRERWLPRQVAEFCAYLTKYLGTSQLEIFHKFL